MSKFAVIIVAAGRGSRFRPNRSSAAPLAEKKPFVPLCGRPVFLYSIEKFARIDAVQQIILVAAPEDLNAVQTQFAEPLTRFGVDLAGGGTERFESVENGLARVRPEIDYIAIHDAARPCVRISAIDEVFAAAIESQAAILAAPVVGTIKRARSSESAGEIKSGGAKERFVETTVPRERLWEAQTPQVFRKELYRAAVQMRGAFAPTDDAALFEHAGFPVRLVESDRTNLKITAPIDLKLAELFLTLS